MTGRPTRLLHVSNGSCRYLFPRTYTGHVPRVDTLVVTLFSRVDETPNAGQVQLFGSLWGAGMRRAACVEMETSRLRVSLGAFFGQRRSCYRFRRRILLCEVWRRRRDRIPRRAIQTVQ